MVTVDTRVTDRHGNKVPQSWPEITVEFPQPQVELTWQELQLGAFHGMMRHIRNRYDGNDQTRGVGGITTWEHDMGGALGEMALAKYLGVFWSGVGAFKAPDVQSQWGALEVRTTRYMTGHLRYMKGEDPSTRYVLMCGEYRHYVIAGWQWGSACTKHDGWFRLLAESREPQWWVPQGYLQSITELKERD